jgi:TetR/AcrR family tetracycline transcriptional repressor
VNPQPAAPTRSKLDRDAVVDTALRVADGEGLEAVTIRRLAQELSVTPMALYWHFKDKEGLLAAVADRMWDETAARLGHTIDALEATRNAAPGEGAPGDEWEPLRLTLDALIGVMRQHASVASLVPTRVVACDAGLWVTERTLAFLSERGLDPARAAAVARFVLCSAVMLVESQPGAEITEPGQRAEVQRLKRIGLTSLPADRYPHVMASAQYLTDCESPDAYFAEGAELVVAGVRHQASLGTP